MGRDRKLEGSVTTVDGTALTIAVSWEIPGWNVSIEFLSRIISAADYNAGEH